ncbi:hypothetical protein D9M68_528650 [compost metagenome]
MVGLPEIAVAAVLFDVDDVVIELFTQAQAELLDALGDDGRAADQRGTSQAFVHHDLRGAQHAFFLAFAVRHALLRCALGGVEDRLHGGARGVDEALQLVAVGVQVLDRAQRHAAFLGRLGHGRRDLHHQARVEGLRNQVFGAEAQLFTGVGGGHALALLGLGQLGDGVHRGDLHLVGDGGGARVERAAEDEREAQDVVDLVRVVGAARGHDHVVAHRMGVFGRDLGVRVGQREDHRLGRHLRDHFRLQHAAGRQAEEHVGTGNHFRQLAHVGLLHVLALVVVHQLFAAFVDHAGQVGDEHVFALQAHLEQQVQAGQRRGARARRDQLHFGDALAGDLQAVEHGGCHRDGRAVLVVVEHRDLHALAQLALDVEAVRGLDVFQVDGAEGGLQRGDDLDQLDRVLLVDLDVEHVDAGEFLEENALAFHHRLGGQRADVAQAQHGGAVGNDTHEVAARGVLEGVGRVLDDFLAGRGHAGRVGQRQVALVDHLLGRRDGDLAGDGKLVVLEGGTAQQGALVFRGGGRRGRCGRIGHVPLLLVALLLGAPIVDLGPYRPTSHGRWQA